MRYEVEMVSYGSDLYFALLAAAWEPFAVVVHPSGGPDRVYFRRIIQNGVQVNRY